MLDDPEHIPFGRGRGNLSLSVSNYTANFKYAKLQISGILSARWTDTVQGSRGGNAVHYG